MVSVAILFLDWRSLVFKKLKRVIKRKFPTVKTLSTAALAQWLADSHQTQPIILDARTEAEYTLSHLRHAQRIEPHNPDVTSFTDSAPIVVYCSVGYRSAKVAECLQQAGCDRVYNLEGSIFEWVNEGHPVYQNERLTHVVHPYNALWGKLLKSRYRAAIERKPAPNLQE